MSSFLPPPPGVAVLREHILGLQDQLFLVGYQEGANGEHVPLFPSHNSFSYLWVLWRSLLPRYAPPHEYLPPPLGTETTATRGEMFRALDSLTRRLEELFGPAPDSSGGVSSLPAESTSVSLVPTCANTEQNPIALSGESLRFPSHFRLQPLSPFSERWRTKREDHDRFGEAVSHANAMLPSGWRLPDALTGDWLASWVNDLFIGVIPKHDRLAPSEVASAVEDVAALVEAIRFMERQGWFARAQRVWFYELPGDPGLHDFPTVDAIRRYRPEWDPRRDLDDQPGDIALSTRYDQTQFFESAAFLLGTPTAEQLAWLRRLAYRADPLQPIWTDPPRHHTWARQELQRTVPELAGCLGVEWPDLGESLSLTELIRRVHNWIVQNARPELVRRGWSCATLNTTSNLQHPGVTTALSSDTACEPDVSEPANSRDSTDLIAAIATEFAESDQQQQKLKREFEAKVAGPARQLRPEWDAAWEALWKSLDSVCSDWERSNSENSQQVIPAREANSETIASALKRVGVTLARFEQIVRSRVEVNPTLHDINLQGLRLPLLPLGRLDYVANDKVVRSNPPRLAVALVWLSVSADEAVLKERVSTLLGDERLRPAFGWLLFIRDCLWTNPPGAEPVDPVGPGSECRDWRLHISVDDLRRVGWLLRGEIPHDCDELFPERRRMMVGQPKANAEAAPHESEDEENAKVTAEEVEEIEAPPVAANPPLEPLYTLGDLIGELDGVEQSRGFRFANQQEQLRRNPLNAMANRAYESALAWRPDETRMPGISRIELLCDRLPGESGITAAKVRRLRADLCERLRCPIPQANTLTLGEAADTLEGVHRVSLADLQSAQQQQLYHGHAVLDTIEVGVAPGDVVQVTGVSCKVIAGCIPTACPDASPILAPSLLRAAEQAIRRLYPLPAGTTIHWLGHDTGMRSRCRCTEYRDAPFAAPFDQHRWGTVPLAPSESPPTPPPVRATPGWEATARRIMFRGQVAKQFKKPAPDQETILAAFQEDGWPDAIDAPLTSDKLARTVESLNDRLQHIKFRLNGAGTGVCWSAV